MRVRKPFFKLYGLKKRFAISIVLTAVLCGAVFAGLYYSVDYFLSNYFEQSDFEEIHIQKQGASLQKFVTEQQISSKDLQKLKKWENRQPVILLELYRGDSCIYSSIYDIEKDTDRDLDYEWTQEDHKVKLMLVDEEVEAVLYSDFTYQYYVLGAACSLVISLILFLLLFLHSTQKLIRYICRLNEEVQILEGGNMEYQVSVEGNDEITDLARSMNRMRIAFQQQIEAEQRLHESNKRLITEMSHDLRTPLTSMMLYLEILRSHHYKSDAELQNYLEKMDAKAHHMKLISDHLFEYSMDNELPAEKKQEPLTMEQAFEKAVEDFAEELTARGFQVFSELTWNSCFVQVKSEYIHRIFENIISNIAKYADPAAEVRIDTINASSFCGFSVLNSCSPCKEPAESNGVGIGSINTMIRQMGGTCSVEQTDTFFEITLLFPKR